MPVTDYEETASAKDTEARLIREYYPSLPYGAVYAVHTLSSYG